MGSYFWEGISFLAIALTTIIIVRYVTALIIKILKWRRIKYFSINTKISLKSLFSIYCDLAKKIDKPLLEKKITKIKCRLDNNEYLNFIIQYNLFINCYHLLFSSKNTPTIRAIMGTEYSNFKSLNYKIANIFYDLIQIKKKCHSLFDIQYTTEAHAQKIIHNINEIMKILIRIK